MLLSPEELKKSAVLDPSIAEFFAANPSPPLDWNDDVAMKNALGALSAMTLQQLGPPEPNLIEEEKEVPMRDDFKSLVKIHRPKDGVHGGGPLIVLIFGGGWVSGDKDSMTPTARALVRLFKAVVVSISYRLAPEHKFPVGQQDAYDSVKWLGQHASEIHADPSKGFLVGGISAGGTNTAVSTLLSIEENMSPKITGQWLCVPVIMNEEHVPEKYKKHFLSRDHNKEAPILSDAALKALAKHTQWDPNSPLRFPILSKVPVEKLPPTFIQADGLDPLRDDALIYDEILKQGGVKTRCEFYPGAPHAHFAFMPGLEITNQALADIAVGFGWLLGTEVGAEEGLRAFAPPAY
ncbi:AB hydrolase superfamily protein [Teratosphaeria destructans]|uniref:AB hydrolase superfamily protein n=1 Tax=Teratosphaeria destructans TaxID=418781 RepID=A0A9W7W0X9_9PEZI|nr:AB hydrolase superfamily protein [Teratosphaeria destructans]